MLLHKALDAYLSYELFQAGKACATEQIILSQPYGECLGRQMGVRSYLYYLTITPELFAGKWYFVPGVR